MFATASRASVAGMVSAVLMLTAGLAIAQTPSPAVAAPPPAPPPAAPPIPQPPGYHTHDGFYIGARFGMGKLRVNYADETISADSLPLQVSVGVAIASRLVIYLEYYDLRTSDVSTLQSITQVAMQGAGGGLKYYLMPINIFASASVLASQLQFGNGSPAADFYGVDYTTQWGTTGCFSVGKEWWLASDLGLGIAAEVLYGRMKQRNEVWGTPPTIYAVKALSLIVSISYN